MNRTSIRRAAVPAAALALGLSLSACGAGNEDTPDTGSGDTGSSDGPTLSGTLSIGGASSQEAAQNAWRAAFQSANPDVTVNYDPIGSGGGREQFISGGFPLAGSDSYLTDEEKELSKAKETCGGDVIEVPDYVSPIAVIYNLDGVTDLNLTPDTLAKIFAGDITSWDDQEIADENPDADLPSETINPVHRSDESGTTGNFTNYLTTVAPDGWTYGEVETWPIKSGEGASGTSGVVSAVTEGPNSIGYADASQAGDLGKANIGVGDEFVAPEPEAAAKIFEVSPKADTATDTQLIFDLDYKTEEAGTYPIVLTSYLIACPTYDDADAGNLVKGYMTYILSEEGQQEAATNAGSAPLPSATRDEAASIVDGIKVG